MKQAQENAYLRILTMLFGIGIKKYYNPYAMLKLVYCT